MLPVLVLPVEPKLLLPPVAPDEVAPLDVLLLDDDDEELDDELLEPPELLLDPPELPLDPFEPPELP